ncbi:Protein ERP1 [Metarhizium anisopliae]
MKTFLPLLSLASAAQALYFFVDGASPKCFFEELPKDTLVVGHYSAEEYDDRVNSWQQHNGITIYISVDFSSPNLNRQQHLRPLVEGSSTCTIFINEMLTPAQEVFDNNHRVVSQRGSASGRFTFTAHEAGDHKICFVPSSTSGRSAWLSAHSPNGGIKMKLDLVIGETGQIESSDKDKLQDIASRVKDLNARLHDIRREQVFQREREADFRDQSESTNARVVRWIIIQLIVIGITCAWQLSHLRSFFIKQKLT